jgi:hypothetical protein
MQLCLEWRLTKCLLILLFFVQFKPEIGLVYKINYIK